MRFGLLQSITQNSKMASIIKVSTVGEIITEQEIQQAGEAVFDNDLPF